MKKLQKSGSFLRGVLAAVGLMACVTTSQAHPYAGALTNFAAGGTNFVSFFMNEGGSTVTVTTYPSAATISLGTLAAGQATFALPPGDGSYTISATKTGTGSPTLISTDTNFNVWDGGVTLRTVAVNGAPKYGDAFGRVYVAATGSTFTGSQPGYNFRQYGVYGLTPDMKQNALFGGSSSNAAAAVYESFNITFTANPANAAVFVMDGITATWTTATITDTLHQIAVTNSAAAAATNLAAWMNLNSNSLPASVVAGVTNNVVTFSAYAQNVSAAAYFSFANVAGTGPFGPDFVNGNGGFGSGPYRIQVGIDDGTVYVTDATDANANIYAFGRNFESTNKVWTVTGKIAGEGALEHGNLVDVAIRGSLAAGNLQLWTADNDLAVPSYLNDTNNGVLGNGGLGNFGTAQETVVGDQNEIYRYDIGSGPFPVTNTPVWACTLGLNGGFPGQVESVAVGPNTNFVYASFRRFNLSDGCVQAFNSKTGARVYTSLSGTPTAGIDPFAGAGVIPQPASGSVSAIYAISVSPDGRYLAALSGSQAPNNRVLIANLTNGVPDESSIVVITNLPSTSQSRHLAWDAADNMYIASSGQTFVRVYSLGITTTCVTSNDVTGTNGSFKLVVPPTSVSLANAGNASQNYGSFSAGHVAFNLTTNNLASPVIVNFNITGTATNGVNYNITTGSIGNGVTVATNADGTGTMTFPIGAYPGAGNWTASLTITPTASPAIGPTLTVTATLLGGPTYISSSPVAATVAIANTGAQFFFITASATGTTMTRAITNDYAKFTITRWGDLSGPGIAGHAPTAITLTNFTLAGTAAYSTDYLAGVQAFTGGVPAVGTVPVVFAAGDITKTLVVGLPVSHSAVLVPATNLTIIPALTNAVTGTNLTSQEGSSYFVSTATTTLTEFDNAQGTTGEIVIWSDPLTNASPTGYAVTFASTNLSNNIVPPVYLPNYLYTNGGSANGSGAGLPNNSNSFDVQLGWPVASENGWEVSQGVGFFGPAYSPPISPVMAANGWSNVLRVSANKQVGSTPTVCGVNVFPTTQKFVGNYALRFDMYLSIWSGALSNPNPLNFPRQFAAFGVGAQGTNCDWRLGIAAGIPVGTGSGPTNLDGVWYCIDAGDQSLTPADFDAFVSPSLPNAGASDLLSSAAVNQAGVFKRPPFPATDGAGAGTPINTWVNVSVETRAQTNVSLVIDNTTIFQSLAYTNNATTTPSSAQPIPGNWTNGVPMLGYLQPYPAQSDESAFVYYSNVRMVELSPYIVTPPTPQLVLAGSNVTFSATASYASVGLTNKWFRGGATPATALQTNSTAATNFTDTLTIANVQANGASNYWSVFSDQAGSVTSYVATLEVITGPANVTAGPGSNAVFTVSVAGLGFAPTFQWQTNGVNLTNGTKYANVTTASVTVSNVGVPDTALTYDCLVSQRMTNLIGLYVVTNAAVTTSNLATAGATLTIAIPPSSVTVTPTPQTNLWGSSASFTASAGVGDPPLTYTWKRNGTNLVGATKYSGTNTTTLVISNLTRADGTNTYQVSVANGAGSATNNPAAILVVQVPPPTLSSNVVLSGGSVAMAFTSTNAFDTTNAFILLSSPIVTGTYTNATGVVFGTNVNGFTVTVPQTTNANMFYRLQHVN